MELSRAASLKKKKKKNGKRRGSGARANPSRGHTPAPRQTAYYPTCRKVIVLAERKAVEVFKRFMWRQLKKG